MTGVKVALIVREIISLPTLFGYEDPASSVPVSEDRALYSLFWGLWEMGYAAWKAGYDSRGCVELNFGRCHPGWYEHAI